ncbi:hypothetical protein COO60DRAFT_1473267 [Scenedesmus sp. NREL 46B-D3]|nr:hypothetical protein COO60DRAFT_1473267 [Scenedesmus sp. NREL 46B-D3]
MEDDWQTVHTRTKDKKQRQKERQDEKRDEPGSEAVSTAANPFAEFDRAFADKTAQQEQQRNAFAELEVHEAPAAAQVAHQSDAEEGGASSADERPPLSAAAPARTPKKQKPKPVAAEVDVGSLLAWMAEAQLRYSTNETAQVEALSDRLLALFREACLDLGKLLAAEGLEQASQQPLSDVPHTLANALASFVASVSESALAAVVAPLAAATAADVAAAAAAGTGAAPAAAAAGKSKAGLLVMLAVILRTRPQVLVQAAGQLRAAGGQLSGPGRLPVLLWVVNQAALAEPAVGVAVWVRVLLPQLLGASDLPTAAATPAHQKHSAGSSGSGDQPKPLEASVQGQAIEYVAALMEQLGVAVGDAAGDAAAGVSAAEGGADVACEGGSAVPTVPGAAVEALSRHLAGKPAAAAGGAAGSADGKKRAAGGGEGRGAAAVAPLLPGLAALAAGSSCQAHFEDWLLLALDSAALSDAAPGAPDELAMRSAAHAVACLCGSDACFALWESKHKSGLRGSARILAALQQQPALMQPLLATPGAADSLRKLLSALLARHHTFLATGKGGWQGACAKVAEDACRRLGRRLPRGRFGGAAGATGGSSAAAAFGLVVLMLGLVVVLGVYRLEVAGVVQAYAGKDAARQLDTAVLSPIAAGLQQLEPYVQQVQQAAAPLLKPLQPILAASGQRLEQLMAYVQQRLKAVDVPGKNPHVDLLAV